MREENKLQGSGAWFNARTGKLTASRMKNAMKYLKGGGDSAERKGLKIEILCERLTGDIVDKFVNQAMQWGIEKNPRRKRLTNRRRVACKGCPFCRPPKRIENCGASPDGMDDGVLLRLNALLPHLPKWFRVLAGVVPEEHKPQMPCNALVLLGLGWTLWRMTQGCQRRRGCL
jgi:hypothetical protein